MYVKSTNFVNPCVDLRSHRRLLTAEQLKVGAFLRLNALYATDYKTGMSPNVPTEEAEAKQNIFFCLRGIKYFFSFWQEAYDSLRRGKGLKR